MRRKTHVLSTLVSTYEITVTVFYILYNDIVVLIDTVAFCVTRALVRR